MIEQERARLIKVAHKLSPKLSKEEVEDVVSITIYKYLRAEKQNKIRTDRPIGLLNTILGNTLKDYIKIEGKKKVKTITPIDETTGEPLEDKIFEDKNFNDKIEFLEIIIILKEIQFTKTEIKALHSLLEEDQNLASKSQRDRLKKRLRDYVELPPKS